jgi:acetyl esterase
MTTEQPAGPSTWLGRACTQVSFASARIALGSLGALSPLLPWARRAARRVHVDRDVRYVLGSNRSHWLDLYWPLGRRPPRAWMLYIHGGGFRMLSKDSHRIVSLGFARQGLAVASINYRLAPAHPFPAALEDCARALGWMVERAPGLGLDLDRLVLAGESAGANLATALATLCCYRRAEPWAREVWNLGVRPRALMAYYGLLQASDPARFKRRKASVPALLQAHLEEISAGYLPAELGLSAETLELADPLLLLERGPEPARRLPACFAAVGTKDPLLPDTRRLAAAYARHGARCEARYYPGQIHGFNVFVWTKAAAQCWQDSYAFLDKHVGR